MHHIWGRLYGSRLFICNKQSHKHTLVFIYEYRSCYNWPIKRTRGGGFGFVWIRFSTRDVYYASQRSGQTVCCFIVCKNLLRGLLDRCFYQGCALGQCGIIYTHYIVPIRTVRPKSAHREGKVRQSMYLEPRGSSRHTVNASESQSATAHVQLTLPSIANRLDGKVWWICILVNVASWAPCGLRVVRIDPLCFLVGCRKRRLNQAGSLCPFC